MDSLPESQTTTVPVALSCSREEDIFLCESEIEREYEERRRVAGGAVFKKEGWCHGPEPDQLPGT